MNKSTIKQYKQVQQVLFYCLSSNNELLQNDIAEKCKKEIKRLDDLMAAEKEKEKEKEKAQNKTPYNVPFHDYRTQDIQYITINGGECLDA